MTILNDIVKNTKAKLVEKKAAVSLDEIKLQLSRLDLPKGKFKASLAGKAEAVIAEIKKASPSAGIIIDTKKESLRIRNKSDKEATPAFDKNSGKTILIK